MKCYFSVIKSNISPNLNFHRQNSRYAQWLISPILLLLNAVKIQYLLYIVFCIYFIIFIALIVKHSRCNDVKDSLKIDIEKRFIGF